MKIELNKVYIEIDEKKYQFYKLTFGFQRRLVEVQSNLNKLQNELAKKYGIEVSEIENSEQVTETEKLEIATAGLAVQEALAGLFVNPEEASILDNFDSNNIEKLINALK